MDRIKHSLSVIIWDNMSLLTQSITNKQNENERKANISLFYKSLGANINQNI